VRSDRDPLTRALDRATGGRALAHNSVRLLDAPTALQAMLDAISGASRRVLFEHYIIKADRTGRQFAEALAAAARRGVDVRVLYDQMGCRTTPRRYWRRLSEAGCAVRPAQPVTPAHLLRLLRRNHRKLCSVDGERAILGGVCIADEWAGDPARGREAWRDAALDVRGPAVGSLETTFGRLWREAVTAFEPTPAGQAELRVIEGIPGGFRLHRAVEFLAATAGHQIWITDAYFVPPPTLLRALTSAARDGVDVRLLLPGQTDLPVVRALTRVGYRDLLRTGVRIWEWHGAMLHSKTALVDGRHFKIGSSNLNPSSLGGNWELDVLVDDPALGAEAAQVFRRDLANSVEIVLRKRVPAGLAGRLPGKVVATDRPARGRVPTRELPSRAVRTVRQVAGGARRSLIGAAAFGLAGAGVLLVALPRVVAYGMAAVAFAFAILATSRVIARWRD